MHLSALLVTLVLGSSNGGIAATLCDENNSDFDGYRQFPSDTQSFAHCTRDVSARTKKRIYADYGITNTKLYCIDHGVSLFAGGNNSQDNLWPNLKDENGQCQKQGLETRIESELKEGQITTVEAQEMLFDYMERRKQELYGEPLENVE
jgi:hypothetical protein